MSWIFFWLINVDVQAVALVCCLLCFSVYVTFSGTFQIMKFSPESVAAFIAVLGILSIIAQVSLLQAQGLRLMEGRPGCHPAAPPGRSQDGDGVSAESRCWAPWTDYRLRNFILSGS